MCLNKEESSWPWWHATVIPISRGLGQENCYKFQDKVGCEVCSKTSLAQGKTCSEERNNIYIQEKVLESVIEQCEYT